MCGRSSLMTTSTSDAHSVAMRSWTPGLHLLQLASKSGYAVPAAGADAHVELEKPGAEVQVDDADGAVGNGDDKIAGRDAVNERQ